MDALKRYYIFTLIEVSEVSYLILDHDFIGLFLCGVCLNSEGFNGKFIIFLADLCIKAYRSLRTLTDGFFKDKKFMQGR